MLAVFEAPWAGRIMREITITANDAGRRLDRFLRKYLKEASLSEIYKFIRKDVKVDGRRRNESYMLSEGEVLALYIPDDELVRLSGGRFEIEAGSGSSDHAGKSLKIKTGLPAKRNFELIYEDEQILIAGKPYGLLTHGDAQEKKDHLANRVKDYLIASGAYDPRERVFTPAPANRLDRNTTGMVLFGKTAAAMRELTRMIRDDKIRKFYLTMASGIIEDELHLTGVLTKDELANKVKVLPSSQDGKEIETIVTPIEYCEFGDSYSATLCQVELVTGRSHQIRAHLASAGHPLIGDSKYANREAAALNAYCHAKCGLSTQLLHAYRLDFAEDLSDYEALSYLAGRTFKSPMPERFAEIFWKLYA